MTNEERDELIRIIDGLPAENQTLLLNALRRRPEKPIRTWVRVAGTLSDEDAKQMMADIEEAYGMASMKSDG